MIELKDWTMRIYAKDRRCKTGERLHKTYAYKDKHEQWMQEEVRDLQWTGFAMYPASKYRIEFDPTWVVVKSLMTGEPVTIRAEDRGGPCDPSMERFWST